MPIFAARSNRRLPVSVSIHVSARWRWQQRGVQVGFQRSRTWRDSRLAMLRMSAAR
ncbi:MAG: hypothetical protein M5R42_01610 [Rhodocyclaceae bacterium]|nr:hypothetical protein [Rhodocyclaceae bacterium]